MKQEDYIHVANVKEPILILPEGKSLVACNGKPGGGNETTRNAKAATKTTGDAVGTGGAGDAGDAVVPQKLPKRKKSLAE